MTDREVDPRFDPRYQRGGPAAQAPVASGPQRAPVEAPVRTGGGAAETALGALAVLLISAGGVWLAQSATRPDAAEYTAEFWQLALRAVRYPLGALLICGGVLAAIGWAAAGVIRYATISANRADRLRLGLLWLVGLATIAGALVAQALSVASLASRRDLVADIGTRAPAETEVLRVDALRAAEAAFGAALTPGLLTGVLAIVVALLLHAWLSARRRATAIADRRTV